MEHNKKYFRLIFLFSVLLLLLNDLFLKDYFRNYLTGKLSDIAGLFAFPYFLSLLFPKTVKLNYILTGIFFVIWKSELIEPILVLFQSIGIGINRTVDYSDLITLLILPISYKYWSSKFSDGYYKIFYFKPLIIVLCSFAFIATSLPKEYGDIHLKSNLEVRLESDIQSVISNLYLSKGKDIYYFEFDFSEQNAVVNATIRVDSLKNGLISVKLDSILDYKVNGGLFVGVSKKDVEFVKKLKKEDFEKIFLEKEIIKLYKK